MKILVVRRDNIGDLICTTPLLRGLRSSFPEALLSVLVSSYNLEVLQENRDVDETFIFLKRRHDNHGYSPLSVIWRRWKLKHFLKKQQFDYIILANGGWRYARKLGGKITIGFQEKNRSSSQQPDIFISREGVGPTEEHEVSKLARLGAVLGVPLEHSLGPTQLFPNRRLVEQERQRLSAAGWSPHKSTIGVHISARCPTRLWPEEHFITLIKKIVTTASLSPTKKSDDLQIVLLWSPGLPNNPMHPGDDEKAKRLLDSLQGLPIFAAPTSNVSTLIAVTSLLDQMICSDGGAMHVAAALNKPILAFFGTTSIESWHPWQTSYVALRTPSHLVKEISVEEAFAGLMKLQETLALRAF